MLRASIRFWVGGWHYEINANTKSISYSESTPTLLQYCNRPSPPSKLILLKEDFANPLCTTLLLQWWRKDSIIYQRIEVDRSRSHSTSEEYRTVICSVLTVQGEWLKVTTGSILINPRKFSRILIFNIYIIFWKSYSCLQLRNIWLGISLEQSKSPE